MTQRLELQGQKFHKLRVVSFAFVYKQCTYWNCACNCGNETIVSGPHLTSGHTQSCGCLSEEIRIKSHTTHGKNRTPIYIIWCNMIQRCTNPKTTHYEDYGGRGITICKQWMKFENFYKDMGDPPTGMSLDRRNNNGNYTPNNCKWSTRKDQSNNQRTNRLITFKNKTLTLSQWADKLNIRAKVICDRINKLKWPIKKAFTTPVRKHKKPTDILRFLHKK